MSPAPARSRARQPWLFAMTGPLTERIGAGAFAEIPKAPGVYHFFGEQNRLLYIGQSANLHARVGSYRFVSGETHAARTVRMVARIRRLEWQVCASPRAALELEAALLLACRPPFNRAGVWLPPPVWVAFDEEDGHLSARLWRDAPPPEHLATGPLPSSFRYTFAALLRCVWRLHHAETSWWDLPCGMTGMLIPPVQRFSLCEGNPLRGEALHRFAADGCPEVLAALTGDLLTLLPESAAGLFWLPDVDLLQKFAAKRRGVILPAVSPAAVQTAGAGSAQATRSQSDAGSLFSNLFHGS